MTRCSTKLPHILSVMVGSLLFSGCAIPFEYIDVPGQHRGARVDGEQSGEWTYFHKDGSVRAQGGYVEDEQDGEWTYWFPPAANAVPQKQFVLGFEGGQLQGPYRRWYRGGDIQVEGFFENGEELGPWTFYGPGEQPVQSGSFAAGQMYLRWSYQYGDGRPRAEGYRLRNEKVGPWTYWDEQGNSFGITYTIPFDHKIVQDTWPDGAVKREGFLREDRPDGQWITWHANGSRRLAGSYDFGETTGIWAAWDPEGNPVAAGQMEHGAMTGDWAVFADGQIESWPAYVFDPPRQPLDRWSDDHAGQSGAQESLPLWLGEMLSRAQPTVWPDDSPKPPSATLASAGQARRNVTIPPQPWRAREQTDMQAIVQLYLGGRATPRARGGFGRYKAAASRKSKGEVSRSDQLIGNPLPIDRLHTLDGVIDLRTFRGRKVAVVIMRGFDGEVCVYCAAQTRALEKSRARFEEAGAEVVVVYPGDGDDLRTFMRAVQSLADEGEEPPYEMAFDSAYQLVEALDIEGAKAMPTTLLLDEQGIVRWAYVGKDKVDRPDVERLIAELQKFPGA